MTVSEPPLGERELDLLLEGVFRAYQYDFRRYARATLRRRVADALAALECPTPTALLDRVLHDRAAFSRLLSYLTVQVSDFFRDPRYWLALRERVVPHLHTYPSLRVWVAGCGSGEEAYSLAIVLQEEGLLDRALVYATDIDQPSLAAAERGVYALDRVRTFSTNYFRAGGRASLSDYYTTAYGRVSFAPELRKHILFADHSLATDSAFAEVQVISCRNVFIYFDHVLQDHAVSLFRQALCPRGFLGLGSHETLYGAAEMAAFEEFVREEKIYRLKAIQ